MTESPHKQWPRLIKNHQPDFVFKISLTKYLNQHISIKNKEDEIDAFKLLLTNINERIPVTLLEEKLCSYALPEAHRYICEALGKIQLSLNEEIQAKYFQILEEIFNIILCFINFIKSKLCEVKIYRLKSVIYILDILETSYKFIDER